jgi:hypothetical protein
MKTKKIKQLSEQFSEFIEDYENIEGEMSSFWFATFGCNNQQRESELLEYWFKN